MRSNKFTENVLGVLDHYEIVCFTLIDERIIRLRQTRQTRRLPPVHHRDPPRLLAPPPHPSSLRLRYLCQGQRPPRLGPRRQLSRRTHQADQPQPRTEDHGPTVASQLPKTQSLLGGHLRVEPPHPASGERKMNMSRILEPQLRLADLELRLLGLQLDPTLRGIVDFLDCHPAIVEHVRRDLERGL